MTERVLVIAEGWTDAILIHRILQGRLGFTESSQRPSLAQEAKAWITALTPRSGEGARMAPTVFYDDVADNFVAVTHAGGVDKVASALKGKHQTLRAMATPPTAVGLVVDVDDSRRHRLDTLREQFQKQALGGEGLPELKDEGVMPGPPRLGLHILPAEGAGDSVEALLIDAAKMVWPDLVTAATSYVDGVVSYGLDNEDLRAFNHDKAITMSIGALLVPKQQPLVALRETRWLEAVTAPENTPPPAILALEQFLREVITGSTSAAPSTSTG